jgi:hypothetical protein
MSAPLGKPFAELVDLAGVYIPLSSNPNRNRAIQAMLREMRDRLHALRAAIEDPDGADELPIKVLEFLDGAS